MVIDNKKEQPIKNKQKKKIDHKLANPKVNESSTDTTRKNANSSNQKSDIKKATLNDKLTAPRSTESQKLKQTEMPTTISSTLQNNQGLNDSNIVKDNNISVGLHSNTSNITPSTSSPTNETTTELDHKGTSAQQQASSSQQPNIDFPINNDYKQNNNAHSQNFVNKNMTIEQKLSPKQSVVDTNIDNRSSKTEDIKQDMNSPMPNANSNQSQNEGLFSSILNSIKLFLSGSPATKEKDSANNMRQSINNNSKSNSLNSNYGLADRHRSNIESTATKNNQDISDQVREVK